MTETVRQWLAAARRIAVLTGAGVSAESGVPTFRDAQTGLWASFRPEDLATQEAFRARPSVVWDWYLSRRDTIGRVEPNAGHFALARFQARHPGRLTLITQNVDGLHQRAGSQGVLALHGNIFEVAGPAACLLPPGSGGARQPATLPAMRQPAQARRRVVRRDAAGERARGR